MLSDAPLFTFEIELVYCAGYFWLVEWCVFWNGDRQVVEMVRLEGDLNGYSEN